MFLYMMYQEFKYVFIKCWFKVVFFLKFGTMYLLIESFILLLNELLYSYAELWNFTRFVIIV